VKRTSPEKSASEPSRGAFHAPYEAAESKPPASASGTGRQGARGTEAEPLKSSRGGFTTPEYLLTGRGGFLPRQGVGELALYEDRLVFVADWRRTEIPFASLLELGIARISRWANPPGHRLLSLVYDDQGQRRTLLFTPDTVWFGTPGDTKRRSERCLAGIREAVKAATGRDVPCVTDKPIVVPASRWGGLIVILMLLGALLLLAATFFAIPMIARVASMPRAVPQPRPPMSVPPVVRATAPGAAGGPPASSSGTGTQPARGAAETSNNEKELARQRLEAAERLLKTAETQYRRGNVAADEYLKAVLARELAAADLKGDPVAAARAKVSYWQTYLRVYLEPRLEAGFRTTQLDVDKARLALAEAKAELAKLEAAGKAKNGTGGQGPPPDIRLPPQERMPAPPPPPPISDDPVIKSRRVRETHQ
jgi:hypothetical protein